MTGLFTNRLLVLVTAFLSANAFALGGIGGLDLTKRYEPAYVQVMCLVTAMPKKDALPIDAVYNHGVCEGLAFASMLAVVDYAVVEIERSSDWKRKACFQEVLDGLKRQDADAFMRDALAKDRIQEKSATVGAIVYLSMKDRFERQVDYCLRK